MDCLRKQIQVIKQKAEAEGDSFQFSLHDDFTLPFFDKMATRLGLGDFEEYLCIPELGNRSFYAAATENTNLSRSCFSIMNILTNGLYVRLGLSKDYNKYLVTREINRKYVFKLIDKRVEMIEKGEYIPTKSNIVDYLILENEELRKAGKEPYSRDEICQHILDVYGAGIDTIMGVFESLFGRVVFKENKEHLETLKNIVRKDFPNDDYSIDALLDHPYLHATFAECSRIFPGLNRSFNKTVIKPFKLCGVKIRKGDDVAVRYLSLNHNKENFPNPDKYDPSRFLDSKKKPPRFSYMQFGHGRRSCVGRTFGDFMVKTFLVELHKAFDFSFPEGFEPNWFHNDFFSGMVAQKMKLQLAK